jgi:flavin reductase (DIM6/NTAB) family NADH-FMN oxidoreductase RutF
MQKDWQEVLDRFRYGIYLVSIVIEGQDNAMIASWVAQCSHEPPLVSVAIRNNRLSCGQIRQAGAFCISLLPQESLGLIKQFKIPDWHRKFEGLPCRRSPHGALIPENVLGYLDCTVEHTIATGDHTLFIGHVVAGAFLNDAVPLSTADYGGNYRGDR